MDVDIGSLVALAAIIWKVTSFVKFLLAKDWPGVKGQAVAWVSAVVVIFLAAQADVASTTMIGERALSALDWQSLILLSITVGSTASVGYDILKGVDGSNSAKEPSIGAPPPPA